VLTREGAVEYPVTFGVLEADPAYTIITNDPAMEAPIVFGTTKKAPAMMND
jgi:hypothetical protein